MGDEREDINGDVQVIQAKDASSGPPPKPEKSSRTPAPIQSSAEPPGALKTARVFLLGSVLVSVALCVVTFLNRDSHSERLVALVTERDPERSAESLEAVAAIVFWGSFGALVLVAVLQAFTISALMRQHAWARTVLVILLVLQVGAVLLAADFLVPSGTEGEYTLLALAAQVPLAGLGLIIAFLPSVSAWLHSRGRH